MFADSCHIPRLLRTHPDATPHRGGGVGSLPLPRPPICRRSSDSDTRNGPQSWRCTAFISTANKPLSGSIHRANFLWGDLRRCRKGAGGLWELPMTRGVGIFPVSFRELPGSGIGSTAVRPPPPFWDTFENPPAHARLPALLPNDRARGFRIPSSESCLMPADARNSRENNLSAF